MKTPKVVIVVAVLAAVMNALSFTREANAMDLLRPFKVYERVKSEVDVEVYLLSDMDLSRVFLDVSADIRQPNYSEIYGREGYLVIRVKSRNNKAFVWGAIVCRVSKLKYEINLRTIPVNKWGYYVIPLGKITQSSGQEPPELTWQWKSFHVK